MGLGHRSHLFEVCLFSKKKNNWSWKSVFFVKKRFSPFFWLLAAKREHENGTDQNGDQTDLLEENVQALQEQLLRERSERQRATQLCKAQDEDGPKAMGLLVVCWLFAGCF